ncbi:MAG TPA: flagellar hook-basal body complex protein FliE, partial [Pirellulales bacterium]|nr:flagellar hook-basal body complex protein FliE [Pirellulales bacterium]
IPVAPPGLVAPNAPGSGAGVSSFKNVLLDSLKQVNSMQQEANRAVENLMTGGSSNPAEVLTAVQKADVAFRMMMQVRNKVVQAYQDIKDIQI